MDTNPGGRRDGVDDDLRYRQSASPSSQRYGGIDRSSPYDQLRTGSQIGASSGNLGGYGDAMNRGGPYDSWFSRGGVGGGGDLSSQQGSSTARGVGIDYSQALGLEPPLHHAAFAPPPPATSTSFGTPPPHSRAPPPATTSGFAGSDAFYSSQGGHHHPMRRSPSRDSVNSGGDYLNQSNEGRLSPALSVASSSGYRSYNQEMPGAYDLHQLPPHQPPLPPLHYRQPGSSSLPPHPRDTSSPFQPPLASSSTTSSAAATSSALEDPRRTTPLSHFQQHHQPNRTSYDETRNSTTPMDVSGGVMFGSARATPVDSFRPVTPPHSSSFPPPANNPKKRDNASVDPMAGAAVQFASLFAENLLSHPCVVLRRQCQVHHRSRLYHVTPFAIIRVILNLQRYQGLSTFWKGIGSTFMVKGLFLVSEQAISELTPFRREIAYESSNLKQVCGHVALKCLAHCLITPFFSSALVESVQSDIASERPGIFDCVREGSFRLVGYGMPQSTRLIPVWHLIIPTAFHGTARYVIAALTQNVHPLEPPPHNSTPAMVETFYREVIGSFCGQFLADVLLYPLETVLHRLHLQGTRTIIDDLDSGLTVLPVTTRYDGVFDCFRCIVREEGRLGLLKGFGALIIQYSIHFALIKITKVVLDQVAELSQNSSHDKRRFR